jgi:signal transduction histidine kinase
VINTIEANSRTEDLLTQSQSLAEELQSRQQELQQTNQELQEKARLLAHQNHEVERKNQEVEQARQALEEKAEQLALTSKYKSEFLANMSHELRTPLNSLLILSDQLCKNPDGNLSGKQVEFSKTIHSSGNDLLMLINDILDLSKIESGTVAVDVSELRLDDLHRSIERSFRHFAESKQLDFRIEVEQPLPKSLVTDVKRLQQIIKNLLSNAFKFTHHGRVSFSISAADSGWSSTTPSCRTRAGDRVLGLGHRHRHLARQAADHLRGVPAGRRLDLAQVRRHRPRLAISRELSRLLGGEIRLVSSPASAAPSPCTCRRATTRRAARVRSARLALDAEKARQRRPLHDGSAGSRRPPRSAVPGMAVYPETSRATGDADGEIFANCRRATIATRSRAATA